MAQIQVLDELTIDKIAAGEVIERPASVVKELVENAIDSQANAITIEIKDGGTSLIRITDNGCGIASEDVPTAFLRHATSKIRSATDLLHISSLGFRGEALSSIAAVAQVELITKTASSITGVRYLIAGGKEQSIENIGCPEGTTFLVRNLFYNVPARQKFLKTAQTEGAHVYEYIQQLALSHPEISFQFIMNGQNRFHTSGNGNMKDIIYTIYGREVASSLLPISFSHDGLKLKVSGFVGKPIVSRGNRSYENYYINNRYIKSNVIYKAVEEAYKTFTMIHRFPFVCLRFDMDPEMIDVNVHPQKMELKFRDERTLYDVLKTEIRSVLLKGDLIPDVAVDKMKKRVDKASNAMKGAQPFEMRRKQQESSAIDNDNRTLSFNNSDNHNVKSELDAEREKLKQLQERNAARNMVEQRTYSDEKNVSPSNLFAPKLVNVSKVAEPKASFDVSRNLDNASNDNLTTEESLNNKSLTIDEINALANQSKIVESVKVNQNEVLIKHDNQIVNERTNNNQAKPEQLSFAGVGFLEETAKKDHRVIGQLFKTYWLIEYDGKLFIMDQHAAHEKVNYERFMKRYNEKDKRYIQQVSPAIVLTLTPKEAVTYEEYKDYFTDFGFEIEHFGGTEYMIHGVPTDLYGIADQDAFVGLLDEIVEQVHGTDTHMIANKIATMACKASVKGGQQLTFDEADRLIDELMTLDSPFTCPHGRPTIIAMTKSEIEKKFKRIQDKN